MNKRAIEGEAMAELMTGDRLEQIVTTAVGKRASARPAAMRAFRAVARDAARAVLADLGVVRVVEIAGPCMIGTPEDIVADVDLEEGAILVRAREKR